MKRDARINFRVTPDFLKIVTKTSEEYKISVSGLISMIVMDGIVKAKVSGKLKNEIKIFIEKSQRKELCNRLYIIKNMYRRVMDMALSYFFTTGSVNMKAINAVLDSFVAEFESYDASLKNKIDVDFRLTVKRLRNREFLLEQSKNIKMLNYASSK